MYRKLVVIAAGLCLAAAPALTAPAIAGTTGTANGTVGFTTPVRSITVSAANPLPLNNCWSSYSAFAGAAYGSAAPNTSLLSTGSNGYCTSGLAQNAVTVTNGAAAGHIDVQATNATGAGGTGTWALVSTAPGADQYGLATLGRTNATTSDYTSDVVASQVVTTATCDGAINGPGISSGAQPADYCAVNANQTAHEDIGLLGPATSSGSATAYNFTLTWTAVP